jgi:hypothetical protein
VHAHLRGSSKEYLNVRDDEILDVAEGVPELAAV